MDEFNVLLKRFRQESRWPEAWDFANRVGCSRGGYAKYENGTRLPNQQDLERIVRLALFTEGQAAAISNSWVLAQTRKAGIPCAGNEASKGIDVPKLATKLANEVQYELKRDGVLITPITRNVLERRMTTILRSVLEL